MLYEEIFQGLNVGLEDFFYAESKMNNFIVGQNTPIMLTVILSLFAL